jgi:hypothetical protein
MYSCILHDNLQNSACSRVRMVNCHGVATRTHMVMGTVTFASKVAIPKPTGPDDFNLRSAQMNALLILEECDEAMRPADYNLNAAAGVDAAVSRTGPPAKPPPRPLRQRQIRCIWPGHNSRPRTEKPRPSSPWPWPTTWRPPSTRRRPCKRPGWSCILTYSAASDARMVVLNHGFHSLSKSPTESITDCMTRVEAVRHRLQLAGHAVSDLNVKVTPLRGLLGDLATRR